MARMWDKWGRRGTEGRADILDKFVGGSGGGSRGKIGFKYNPSAKGAKNISGDTQTAGKVAQSPSEGVLSPSRKISYLLDKGFNKLLGLFAVGGATKALNKRKEDKKKRVGRTILTSN